MYHILHLLFFLLLLLLLFQLSTGLRAQPRGGMTSTGATLRCFLLPLWWWGWSCCLSPNNAELQRFDRPTKPDGSLSFLVVGDWGRRGSFNQSRVASQMGRIGEKLGVDFVVSTGDNFYDDGLTGVDDPAFEESFTKIYTAPSLQKQWYSVLGNHDYRGDAEAQSSPMLTQIDWRWLCLRSFIVNAESAEIFFVDTTPFVRSYFTDSKGHTYDWRAIRSRKAYMRQVIEDLASALRESAATWKIVVAHHAIRSIGHHGDTEELVQLLLPILRANNVDFYLNGHDHCLEHIHDEDSRIQFLTSGAGSKAWRGDIKDITREGLQFFYDGQGFMSVWLSRTEAEIVFYNVDGEVLHRFSVSKDSHQIHMKGRRGKNYIVTLAGKLKRNDQL